MNVFGAFTFGSLIKTFLPGLVWLVALTLLEDDLASVTAVLPHLRALPAMQGEAQNLLVLTIPVAILLGLVSNIVVFMGINDWLVRKPFKRSHPEIHNLYEWLCNRVLVDRLRILGCEEPQLKSAFRGYVDTELLILNALGVTNLAYVREQYWYHLEFQINLMFACLGLLITILCSPHVYGIPLHEAVLRGALSVIVLGGMSWLLVRAAKKNYRRHIAKMCSLIAAVFCAELKEQPDPATAGSQPDERAGVAIMPVFALAALMFGAGFVTKRGLFGRGAPR